LPAYEFFCEFCMTQWRVGMNGPTGLDHASVLADLKTLCLPHKEASSLYEDIRHMERVALKVMREQQHENK
jgi:hypothetical protein